MNELLEYGCIDLKKLLILKAKSLKIKDFECYLLLIIMTLDEIGLKPITPAQIQQFCSLPLKKIYEILLSLVDQHFIARRKGSLDLKPLYLKLMNQEVEKEESLDLISIFENAFGRSFNQMELECISNFKRSGYDDEMIVEALNESVKAGVVNFRYIERILENWSQYGVKKRFVASSKKVDDHTDFDSQIKNYKWWLNHE